VLGPVGAKPCETVSRAFRAERKPAPTRRRDSRGEAGYLAADIIEHVAATGRPVLRGESFAESPDQTAAAEERQRKAP